MGIMMWFIIVIGAPLLLTTAGLALTSRSWFFHRRRRPPKLRLIQGGAFGRSRSSHGDAMARPALRLVG